jgi:uncharacterized membrane protein YhaH (DUF805 family)
MDWYMKVMKNYVGFSGRARRREYWMFTLFNLIAAILIAVIDNVLGTTTATGLGMLGLLYALLVFLPSLAVCVRRLHDTGRSGWWVLIALIPLLGAIVLLVFMVLDGNRGNNEYGPDPKAMDGGGVPAMA